jgi:hypothetical protein
MLAFARNGVLFAVGLSQCSMTFEKLEIVKPYLSAK